MGRELQELPHCTGLISNLSGGQIYRALVSVKSENRRRQRLLKRWGSAMYLIMQRCTGMGL